MMPAGPTHIAACPDCGALFRKKRLTWFSFAGTRRWTDTEAHSPLLTWHPPITRCHRCKAYFWVCRGTDIGELDFCEHGPDQLHPRWTALPGPYRPTEAEYYEALNSGHLVDEHGDEESLRFSAWTRSNDVLRGRAHPQRIELKYRAARERNMHRLLEMLKRGDEYANHVTRAELHRELGQYRAALRILRNLPECDGLNLSYRMRRIRALARLGDPFVREWHLPFAATQRRW